MRFDCWWIEYLEEEIRSEFRYCYPPMKLTKSITRTKKLNKDSLLAEIVNTRHNRVKTLAVLD